MARHSPSSSLPSANAQISCGARPLPPPPPLPPLPSPLLPPPRPPQPPSKQSGAAAVIAWLSPSRCKSTGLGAAGWPGVHGAGPGSPLLLQGAASSGCRECFSMTHLAVLRRGRTLLLRALKAIWLGRVAACNLAAGRGVCLTIPARIDASEKGGRECALPADDACERQDAVQNVLWRLHSTDGATLSTDRAETPGWAAARDPGGLVLGGAQGPSDCCLCRRTTCAAQGGQQQRKSVCRRCR